MKTAPANNTAPVSVVIPAYNSAGTIGQTLESILAQTLVPRQIIVIDDGSKDATGEVVRGFGEPITYRRQENAGPSAARNHGLRLACEPWIAFIDADDVWHPRKIELQMRCLAHHPELGLLATDNFDWPIARFPEISDSAAQQIAPVTWEQLVIRTLILTSTVIAKRGVMQQAGEFDSSLCGPEDRDMFLRVAKITPIGMMAAALAGYRDTTGSLTKQASQCEAGMRKILARIDAAGEWNGRWALRSKAYSFMHYRCATAQARAGKHAAAVWRGFKSLARYPLPYQKDEVHMAFDRPKRLAVNMLRLLKLKRPDAASPEIVASDQSALEQWKDQWKQAAAQSPQAQVSPV